MERPQYSNAIELVDTLPALAKSKKVESRLREEFGAERVASILTMMKAGKLGGSVGADIHDFFSDEIHNEAETVWSQSTKGGYGPFDVEVKEYEGVYFVAANEFDDVGYFLDLKKAQSYVTGNFKAAGEQEEEA